MRPVRSRLLTLWGISLLLALSIVESKQSTDEAQVALEDELTERLAEDLMQSLEKKFNLDLQRSVDTVLTRVRALLLNGTAHVKARYEQLKRQMLAMKEGGEGDDRVSECVMSQMPKTSSLAEKALHQMVVCGYALIGHDPAQAIALVMQTKDAIRLGLEPLQEQKEELNFFLKKCGHQHDSLNNVVRCVISKSPAVKSIMMSLYATLVDGVVDLTKVMSHGAMHEACLIEVVKSIEDEAADIIQEVTACSDPDERGASVDDTDVNASMRSSGTMQEDNDRKENKLKPDKTVGKILRKYFMKKRKGRPRETKEARAYTHGPIYSKEDLQTE